MSKKDSRIYVESKISTEKHEYSGWFWHLQTKKFYRWNDFMFIYKYDYFDTDLSSMKRMEIEHGNS